MPIVDIEKIFSDSEQNWIGFEPNERDKMGPRLAKMKDSLSPERYATKNIVKIFNNLGHRNKSAVALTLISFVKFCRKNVAKRIFF